MINVDGDGEVIKMIDAGKRRRIREATYLLAVFTNRVTSDAHKNSISWYRQVRVIH